MLALHLGFADTVEFVAIAAALGLYTLAIVPSRIDVGADGVFLRWLLYRRFVPYSRILGIVHEPGEADGSGRRAIERLTVRVDGGRDLFASGRADTTELESAAAAIDERLTAYISSTEPLPFMSRLARCGQETRMWIERVRGLAACAASYRDPMPSHEELARIVADPHAGEEERVGAGMALAAAGEEGRARLRVASEAMADPTLRAALDAGVSGDAAALEHLLREIAR